MVVIVQQNVFNLEKTGRERRKKMRIVQAPRTFPKDNVFNNRKINLRE